MTDESGAPLSGATVIALHTPTGTKYATSSRKDGRFNLPNLRIGGPYTIAVTYVGFKKSEQDNITLLLGQEFKADFHLVSDSKELKEIVVAASRQNKVFNSSRNGSQEIISRAQIERLPTISRSLQDFTKLEPTANGLNIGGRSNQYNNMTVDGANFNNSFGLSSTLGGQTGQQPISLDAIEQIQVNVSPYDVTQGGFSGTGINTVTKSGTNQFKGTVYTYLKGPNTQGYDVANTVVTKSPFKFNTRGFAVGGPIIQDKVFFFVSGEQVRQTAPATSFVATDANHPAGTPGVSSAKASDLDALSTFLDSAFGYKTGAYQGYSFKTQSDKITAKIDWNINGKSTLTVKYNYLKSMSDQFASTSRPNSAGGQVTGGQPGTSSMPFFNSGYVINNNFNILIAELNTRLNSQMSNKFQVGYTALRDFRTPHGGSNMPLVDIFNSNGAIMTTFGYEPFTYNNTLNTDVYQLSDIFKLYQGAHELTFGFQGYYRKYANAFAPGYQGSYQFSSLADFYNSVKTGAPNAKNYYLQYSALKDGSFPWANAGSTELGLFAQDKWRITNNFTLTYGLRVDVTRYKQSFTDNPVFDTLKFAGQSYNIGQAPKTRPLISPRVGFNWDVLGDKTLQIRGGAGIFSGPPPFVWISNQASNNGVQFGSIYNANQAFSADPDKYRPAAGLANTSYATAVTDHNFKYPQVLKTSIAIDKKLPGDVIFTLEGTYSKDLHAVYYKNLNLNEEHGYELQGADNRIRYALSSAASVPAADTSNKYYAGKWINRPNLTSAILMANTNKGYSYTITARVQKSFGNLFASIAYTYADVRNTAEGGSTASSLWSARAVSKDPNTDNLAYGSFYQPHRVIAYTSYRFEYAKHFNTSIGAIFEAAPAGVTSYIYNGDLNGDGNSNDLMYIPRNSSEINLVPSSATDTRTASQIWAQLDNYIKQDNYLSSHRGEYAKANAVVFPWYKKLDLNITQDIYFFSKRGKEADKHTLRLTLDLINAGNFLNKYWGLVKTPNLSSNAAGYQLLKFEGLAADGKTPLFSLPLQDATNQVPYVNSYQNSTGIGSRWQMQFGIRYLFN
ncbi:TonB-dependent receptor [Niastella koreensis]|uniref:TonB-dependent receptor n=1 Tax=Niastella koreensis TaxID=354356 RepID=UPI001F6095E1|nr:carboxypeptidase regulatory-like domain-containing protein [Niastella koreensis]